MTWLPMPLDKNGHLDMGMSLQLRELTVLLKGPGSVPNTTPGGSEPPVPVPGYATSSDLCSTCTHI